MNPKKRKISLWTPKITISKSGCRPTIAKNLPRQIRWHKNRQNLSSYVEDVARRNLQMDENWKKIEKKNIYIFSWPIMNHKVNRATFKDFFGCLVIAFQAFGGFLFPPFDRPYFGWSHLTHFFIFFNNSTFCGCENSRATIPFWSRNSKEHSPEIRRPLRH
jgi:hypothetical protein